MVSAYFVFTFLLLVLIYNISTGNNQFAATASVIRQIWSGRCQSCAQSTLSEFSVLSGTVDLNRASNQVGSTSHNRNCVCDSCPCALVENLLTKCSPIPQILQETVNTIAQLIHSIYSVFENVYEDFARVLRCGGTCQREPQALGNHGNSSAENLSNSNKKQEISNEQGRKSKSNISFIIDADDSGKKGNKKNKKNQESNKKDEARKKSNQDLNIIEHKKSKTNHESKFFKKKEKETKVENESADDNVKPSGSVLPSYCTKCQQQNKSCSEGCPKAKK